MKRAAKFCQFEKIERFVPFQHERPNIYIWLCRGKDALFTHILFVETGCTSKPLQGEMCRSSIDKMHMENFDVQFTHLLLNLNFPPFLLIQFTGNNNFGGKLLVWAVNRYC